MVAHNKVFGLLLVDELRTVNTGIGDRGSGTAERACGGGQTNCAGD